MVNYQTTFDVCFSIVVIMAMGAFFRIIKLMKPEHLPAINKLVFHACLPLVTFKTLIATPMSTWDWNFINCFLVLRIVCAAFFAITTVITKRTLGDFVSDYMAGSWLNTIVFGQPIIKALYPKLAGKLVPLTVLSSFSSYFFQLPFMLICFEVNKIFFKTRKSDSEIESRSQIKEGDDEKEKKDSDGKELFDISEDPKKMEENSQRNTKKAKKTLLSALFSVSKVTPLYGVILGVIVTSYGGITPFWIDQVLTTMGNIVQGAVTFLVGLHLVGALKFWRTIWKRALLISFFKLMICPLIGSGLIYGFGIKREYAVVALVLSMMPTAFPAFTLAKRYKESEEMMSAVLSLTLFLVLPFIIIWINIGEAFYL